MFNLNIKCTFYILFICAQIISAVFDADKFYSVASLFAALRAKFHIAPLNQLILVKSCCF